LHASVVISLLHVLSPQKSLTGRIVSVPPSLLSELSPDDVEDTSDESENDELEDSEDVSDESENDELEDSEDVSDESDDDELEDSEDVEDWVKEL